MRALYYTASVITLTGGNTNADGDPCEPGHGYTEQDGFLEPRRRLLDGPPVPRRRRPGHLPRRQPAEPAEWLAEQITDRLGDLDYVDGPTFGGARTAIEPGRLTGPDADQPGAVAGTCTFLGDVFAAHRLATAPPGTRTVTATAHACGFTDTELAEAATLLGYDLATNRH